MFKKWMITIGSIVMAAAALGFSVMPAFAAAPPDTAKKEASNTVSVTVGQTLTDNVGNAGIFMAKSGYAGEMDLTRSVWGHSMNIQPANGVKIIDRMLTWSVEKVKEQPDTYLHSRTNVYFDLSRQQQDWFMNGKLAIYAYNTGMHTWTKLPTFNVNGANFRVGAVATEFGTYALGLMK